ncbi:coiled-coil domain-containing protein 42 like-2-like [Astyanax mexicanus]|uniref:Coiled-coil domain-containing protein 42 like-2-like n=1 Tax=Astyanax mexicanus TaxID=7994 RepID=A0A8B9I039_ASTMX|nr:coiled-coil domain-containing protein 42 like-2-like [Astyanax mexicanus]KAG9282471.1 coiled-coil domain-containing protein 42 like-2-like [Astyanax mexicanus]
MFRLKDTTVPMPKEDLWTGTARILDKQREIKYIHAVLRKHKERQIAALLTKKEKLQKRVSQDRIYWSLLDSVLKSSDEFEDFGKLIGRFKTLVRTKEQLLKRQSTMESEREREAVQLRQYVSERRSLLQHYENTLSQLQTELNTTRSQARRLESTEKHIQKTDAKRTLLLGRIHVATRNLYQMTGGVTSGAEGFNVKDTLDQLDRIQQNIQMWTEILQDLGSDKGSIKASNHA